MRQFMKNKACEIGVVLTQHGAQQRVTGPAKRGIGGDARDIDVQPLSLKFDSAFSRGFPGEITPVWNAAENRKAPCSWRQRELRRGKNGPGHGVPMDVDIAAVAVVFGQCQFICRKPSYGAGRRQFGAQCFRRRRITDEFSNIFAGGHDLRVTLERLRVVGNARAAGRPGRDDRRGKHPKNALHCLPTLAHLPMQQTSWSTSNRRHRFPSRAAGAGGDTDLGRAMRAFA